MTFLIIIIITDNTVNWTQLVMYLIRLLFIFRLGLGWITTQEVSMVIWPRQRQVNKISRGQRVGKDAMNTIYCML